MADHASHPDDISALWGPRPEGLLAPEPPTNGGDPHATGPALANGHRTGNDQRNQSGSGAPAVDHAAIEDISRLADAMAGNGIDIVRRSDLDGMRSDFAHHLAVALYELMAASNGRLSSAEDRMNQRVTEALEAHSSRLAVLLEAQQRADNDRSQMIASELSALRERWTGHIDGLSAFQRELRHEVGRLSDLVRDHGVESAEMAEATTQRFNRTEDQVAKAAGDMGDVLQALETIKEELGRARQELAELRVAVEADRMRKSGWRSRSR